jgi:predicted MarR family transcription regulator
MARTSVSSLKKDIEGRQQALLYKRSVPSRSPKKPTASTEPARGEARLDPARYVGARSWHLAATRRDEVFTSFEFGLLQTVAAFERWSVQATRLSGGSDSLSFSEVVLLHMVRMHDRSKDAATLAKLVNRDDLPNVLYSLRKLANLGLIEKTKVGSATFFQVTEQGRVETERYAELRQAILLSSVDSVANMEENLAFVTTILSIVTGFYESAARECASLNPETLFGSE